MGHHVITIRFRDLLATCKVKFFDLEGKKNQLAKRHLKLLMFLVYKFSNTIDWHAVDQAIIGKINFFLKGHSK